MKNSIKSCSYFLLFVHLLVGCFQTSNQENTTKQSESNSAEAPKENIIRNFLAYSDINLGDVLDKYDNIESIKIEDSNGRNSVFISGDSIYKSRTIRLASTSDNVKVLVTLNSGETISLLRR